MIAPDREANRYLLSCLKLLFPECVIESLNEKVINDTDGIIHDNISRVIRIKGEDNVYDKDFDA